MLAQKHCAVLGCVLGCLCLWGCAGTKNAAVSAATLTDTKAHEAVSEQTQIVESDNVVAPTLTAHETLPAVDVSTKEAIHQTNAAVENAWQMSSADQNALLRDALEQAFEKNNAEVARQLFDKLNAKNFSESEWRELQVRMLIAEARYDEARQSVRKAADNGDTDAIALYWRALDADPLYGATFVRTIKPDGNNSLSALGGGSTVSLKYKEGVNTLAAIKPDQDLRQTMYRSEIAYFRLCEILGCSFDVPKNVPVRFRREHFNALYAASTSTKNAGYRSKFDHLIWVKEDDTKVLYATFKEWISPFTGFPIENTDTWKQVVQPDGVKDVELESLIKRVLVAGRPSDYNNFSKIKNWTNDLSMTDFARQLSDLMLVDFLTNNWDRFSGAADNYGANCHIHPGGLIAIDNGAAFPAWHAPRVVKRLEFVRVFNRDLVRRLRALTPEMINHRLFPNPTKEEKKSLQRFWERRDQALKHIDEQIKKYGEDAVLAF